MHPPRLTTMALRRASAVFAAATGSWGAALLAPPPPPPPPPPATGAPPAAATALPPPHQQQHHQPQQQQQLQHLRPVQVVGGHGGIMSDGAFILKPLQGGKRGRAEAKFYSDVFQRGATAPPACFMPSFHGIVERSAPPADADASAARPSLTQYLVLEDVTKPFRHPSIMDIKMGVQAWDEDASPAKIEQERSKYPTQQEVGLRFTGMRVYRPGGGGDGGAHKEHGRAFGYALREATLHHAFYEYLHNGDRLRVEVIPPLLEKLLALRDWFEGQSEYRFYGSSLLFIYEGGGGGAQPPAVDIRMIDFAHVWPIRDSPTGRDDGYVLGLETIIACLDRVVREHAGVADGG